jgi:hypothetical protein
VSKLCPKCLGNKIPGVWRQDDCTCSTDPLRCHYADCVQRHPVVAEDEQITCRSCREYLGLPSLENT